MGREKGGKWDCAANLFCIFRIWFFFKSWMKFLVSAKAKISGTPGGTWWRLQTRDARWEVRRFFSLYPPNVATHPTRYFPSVSIGCKYRQNLILCTFATIFCQEIQFRTKQSKGNYKKTVFWKKTYTTMMLRAGPSLLFMEREPEAWLCKGSVVMYGNKF